MQVRKTDTSEDKPREVCNKLLMVLTIIFLIFWIGYNTYYAINLSMEIEYGGFPFFEQGDDPVIGAFFIVIAFSFFITGACTINQLKTSFKFFYQKY